VLECFNNESPSRWVIKAYAIVALTLACLLHGVWRAGGIWASNICAFFKIMMLLFIIALGFAVRGEAFHNVSADIGNYDVDKSFANTASAPYGYAIALLAVRFSYGGFENAHCEFCLLFLTPHHT
jgi:amino acid transporter